MIHHGDCLDVMATLEPESVAAIVTDPPYDLTSGKRGGTGTASVNLDSPYGRSRIGTGNGAGGFMGKAWDGTGIAFRPETWALAFAAAKPGAHLLAFGGTRTYHRMAVAIEDAGWEIRDCLVWAYASGFPKSLDVSKAIDKAAGAERPVIRERNWHDPMDTPFRKHFGGDGPDGQPVVTVTGPATDAARQWDGWGTALKPAWEPIVMARKPLRGTVAANVLAYGTGGLNIDGTRIAGAPPSVPQPNLRVTMGRTPFDATERNGEMSTASGRWPANVLLTDPIFDGGIEGVVGGGYQESTSIPGSWAPRGAFPIDNPEPTIYGDSGTYSRFFLIPKADRAEREPIGLDAFEGKRETAHRRTGAMDTPYLRGETVRRNTHPTVKPVDLMRHLVRLVTPPGGLVLDPFLGSGTTGIACEMEGFDWIGIEREAEYVAIAQARLEGVQKGLGLSA